MISFPSPAALLRRFEELCAVVMDLVDESGLVLLLLVALARWKTA